MKLTKKLLLLPFAILLVWTGCKKDDDAVATPHAVHNEEEVITTIKLTFVDSANTSNIKYATFRDPDGDGGAAYDIFDTIKLEANKTWNTSILLLNESGAPVDTISNEVLEEANDHLFCFTPSEKTTVSITDLDGNKLPLGLESKWVVFDAGMGTMRIELKHQPNIKDGTCSPGSTDLSVDFIVEVK